MQCCSGENNICCFFCVFFLVFTRISYIFVLSLPGERVGWGHLGVAEEGESFRRGGVRRRRRRRRPPPSTPQSLGRQGRGRQVRRSLHRQGRGRQVGLGEPSLPAAWSSSSSLADRGGPAASPPPSSTSTSWSLFFIPVPSPCPQYPVPKFLCFVFSKSAKARSRAQVNPPQPRGGV